MFFLLTSWNPVKPQTNESEFCIFFPRQSSAQWNLSYLALLVNILHRCSKIRYQKKKKQNMENDDVIFLLKHGDMPHHVLCVHITCVWACFTYFVKGFIDSLRPVSGEGCAVPNWFNNNNNIMCYIIFYTIWHLLSVRVLELWMSKKMFLLVTCTRISDSGSHYKQAENLCNLR